MNIPKYAILTLGALIISATSCDEYLGAKPEQSLVVPQTLDDLEAMLNNQTVIYTPALPEILSDNYYVESDDWNFLMSYAGLAPTYFEECMNYVWDPQAYHNNSWSEIYRYPVYLANVVLDVLNSNSYNDRERANWLEGSALFYRANAFERLAQLYAKPFSSASPTDLGIVLRTTSNINVTPERATVHKTYDKILEDLRTAAELLPESRSYPTVPSKAAAYGALARTYLNMRNYELAGLYADKCLSLRSELMDYNLIDGETSPVFAEYNVEVIFHTRPVPPSILAPPRAKIAAVLYQSYEDYDLRKTLFFYENTESVGTYSFRGSYLGKFNTNGSMVFDGITTAEMLLVRAECSARLGDLKSALDDLNFLMAHRVSNTSAWQPYGLEEQHDILEMVLSERRKELVFRGLRWGDLRRLNEEGANITLQRVINGVKYELPPNDKRWVMLLPPEVISRSNLTQNPR